MASSEKLPDLETVLIYQLYRIGRVLRSHHQNMLDDKAPDFSPEQFFLLYRLFRRDGQTQRELADKTLNDHPNITRMIDKLEMNGYVVRAPDKEDRRTFNIMLTNKAKKLFEQSIPLIEGERKKLLSGITAEDEKAVRKVLAQIEKNIG
jgi:DNA-binding MarR family transcriptional regulator